MLVVVEQLCVVVVLVMLVCQMVLGSILVYRCRMMFSVLQELNMFFLFFCKFLLQVSGVFLIIVSSVIRLLKMCFVLLCVSLDMLGFFFCGMMLDLVVCELGRVMKLNLKVEYKISFLERCERCVDRMVQVFRNFNVKLWLFMLLRLLVVGCVKFSVLVVVCWLSGQGVFVSVELFSGDLFICLVVLWKWFLLCFSIVM